MSFDLKALWREPSTKRGLVMLITGGAVLYQTIFNDGSVDIAGMESRIERWIGIGMMLAGLLGWLPDSQTEKTDEPHCQPDQKDSLPHIEFVGRSESVSPIVSVDHSGHTNPDRPAFNRYRDDDRVSRDAVQPERSDENGWNG